MAGKRAGSYVLPEGGAASYHLRVKGVAAGRYTLFVPRHFAASRVLVNGKVVTVDDRQGGTVKMVGCPIKMSNMKPTRASTSPASLRTTCTTSRIQT